MYIQDYYPGRIRLNTDIPFLQNKVFLNATHTITKYKNKIFHILYNCCHYSSTIFHLDYRHSTHSDLPQGFQNDTNKIINIHIKFRKWKSIIDNQTYFTYAI